MLHFRTLGRVCDSQGASLSSRHGGYPHSAPRTGDGADLARCWLDAAAYYASLNPELFRVPAAEGLAQWFEDRAPRITSDSRLALVAERDGQVVGFIGVTVQQPVEDAARQLVRDVGLTRLVVNALVVERGHWRRGIGARLLGAAEACGRGRGAAIALLDTHIDSPVSVPFYEQRMGYSRQELHLRKRLV